MSPPVPPLRHSVVFMSLSPTLSQVVEFLQYSRFAMAHESFALIGRLAILCSSRGPHKRVDVLDLTLALMLALWARYLNVPRIAAHGVDVACQALVNNLVNSTPYAYTGPQTRGWYQCTSNFEGEGSKSDKYASVYDLCYISKSLLTAPAYNILFQSSSPTSPVATRGHIGRTPCWSEVQIMRIVVI
ncbi:hypothetical protein SISSUDRAFT_244557 [Sistotremastrum suecicum HHB10207 ss-3]|uniref:Uncharacterized protein n=1 Tax=Sistotremastrum suecicum HHB10207 ss-3 TaxID=1314776 RepID=A0A165ZZL6_9AGAM|nr:hypothetical protein SISSUDRAFT_244557 [Sistotremastrum suecicum HHB10207 ss-3]